jgi:hypothetical protein
VSRTIAAIRDHRVLGWAAFIAYAAAVTFPHEDVQWAVNEFQIRIGGLRHLYRLSAAIALGLAVILTALLLRAPRRPQARTSRICWFAAIGLITGAWATLTANNVELVHYPQYFPEGLALTALTLSPTEALAWIVIFGGLDEGYQYWVLSHGRPTLLDFNDIYMDLLGGMTGIVFAMAYLPAARLAKRRPWREWKRPGIVVLFSVSALGIALWAAGLMRIVEDKSGPRYWFALGRFRAPSFWAQIVANGPNRYHTLTPCEGMILIWATIAFFAFAWAKYALKAGDDARSK